MFQTDPSAARTGAAAYQYPTEQRAYANRGPGQQSTPAADAWQGAPPSTPLTGCPPPSAPMPSMPAIPQYAPPAAFRGSIKMDYTKSTTSNYPMSLRDKMSADEFADVHARMYWTDMEAQIKPQKWSLWAGLFSMNIGGLAVDLFVSDDYVERKTGNLVKKLNREYASRGIGFRYVSQVYERCIYMDVT